MITGRRPRLLRAARGVALGTVLVQVAKAATAAPALRWGPGPAPAASISVVVPARDEAERIRACLAGLAGATGVIQVVVVDDCSTDATADIARAAGSTVVSGGPLPTGWAGKAWALHQGIGAATGEWIVTLDADARPLPALADAAVRRAKADGLDLLSVAGAFECPTAAGRWLHPALLTTLVYRFGPAGARRTRRVLANGQCMVFRRDGPVPDALCAVRGHVVEDVALARCLRRAGKAVAMLDGSALLTVRMYDSLADTWRGWGRSLALPGVESPWRQALDITVLASAQALPLMRLLAGRADVVDAVALAARAGTVAGTRRAYRPRGAAYWLSPLADVAAVILLALSALRPRQAWRGRAYGRPGPPERTAGRSGT